MKCPQIRIHLKEYHDGNLTSELAGQIAAHLGTCDECAKELAFLQSYLPCAKKIPLRKAPSQFAAIVEQKISNSIPPVPKTTVSFQQIFRLLPIPVTALASILLVITFLFASNNPLKFIQNKQDKELTPDRLTRYSAQTESKAAADDQGVSNQSADKDKAQAESLQTLTAASDQINGGINQLPVLTLIIKTPVSGNKKEAAPIAASETSLQTNKSVVEEIDSKTDSKITGPSKDAEFSQIGLTPIIDNLRAIIINLGGKWTVSTASPGTKPSSELMFTLPAGNYQDFLASISQYGEVKSPYPPIGAGDREMITIKMQLVLE